MCGLYEISKIQKNGKTGKRLGIVKASSHGEAVHILSRRKTIPKVVRVHSVRLKKSEDQNKKLTIYGSGSFNIKMPNVRIKI